MMQMSLKHSVIQSPEWGESQNMDHKAQSIFSI